MYITVFLGCPDCAQALGAAGINELIVHGSNRTAGYRPPARWEWIDKVRAATGIPLIAEGLLSKEQLAA